MSSITRRIAPIAMGLFTSPSTRSLRRSVAEARRRFAREPHRVHYFHQADDPYSHLAAQLLAPLRERWEVELIVHLVAPPSDAAAPERARLEAFSRKDAADVAAGYGLRFPSGAQAPGAGDVRLATRILAAAIEAGRFAEIAPQVGDALWAQQNAAAALARLAEQHGTTDDATAQRLVDAGTREREKRGHYLSAMFHYAGEWYWGVDRLHHLERRLESLDARRAGARAALLAKRPDPSREPAPPPGERLVLDVFPSLRSPYTYIALQRSYDLAKRLPVELALRPVLPMVMRGLPVPREKQLYIVLDTKREAEDAGVPFGRICDPVGRPVERCFSLWRWARERGRGAELLLAFTRAAFAEGIDTGTDAGMRHVVERAGLAWQEARERLDQDEGWRAELEANREAMFALGLWGVPSYCLRDAAGQPLFWTWGQDRLWRVEEAIRARLSAGN